MQTKLTQNVTKLTKDLPVYSIDQTALLHIVPANTHKDRVAQLITGWPAPSTPWQDGHDSQFKLWCKGGKLYV